jgi:hypothetical protein
MLRFSPSRHRIYQIFGLMTSNETHEPFCDAVVHFGAGVGSVTDEEHAAAEATARARTA